MLFVFNLFNYVLFTLKHNFLFVYTSYFAKVNSKLIIKAVSLTRS